MLNEFGQAMPVEDVFVRKADANCRNFYNMKVNEYKWRLPNTSDEWQTIRDILSSQINDENYSLITPNEWSIISGYMSPSGFLSNPETLSSYTISNVIDDKIENSKFKVMNTMYITNDISSESQINEVISDNYLNKNENISITWKYIDYVYIYYTCYSSNAYYMLEKLFTNKIYDAVRAKLNDNINNLNANSALKNKYSFSGGIAIRKTNEQQEITNDVVFDWRSSSKTVENWEDFRRETRYDVYGDKEEKQKVVNKTYEERYNWEHGYTIDKTLMKQTTSYETLSSEQHAYKDTITKVSNYSALNASRDSDVILENPKYKSTEDWIKSFEPIMIKYRIN
jgi:hypothetical protein